MIGVAVAVVLVPVDIDGMVGLEGCIHCIVCLRACRGQRGLRGRRRVRNCGEGVSLAVRPGPTVARGGAAAVLLGSSTHGNW